ncbi:MAG: acyl-CoA-binding protein [Chitinophagaceae bacterium]
MELTSLFEKSVEDSKTLQDKPSNETLLLLYSLYKQSTVGDNTNEAPGAFDFVAKAKYEAWMALQGKTKDEAMQEYIKLVEKLKS